MAWSGETLLTTEIKDLIGRAHFTQGNIADHFWENIHLRKALKKLAKAKPFDFEPPKRKDFPRKLLPRQVKRVQKHVDALLENTTCKTCTLDGWDNLQKIHWLAKCVITEHGPLFRTASNAHGVLAMDATWTLK